MDFKIDDNYDEEGTSTTKKKSAMPIVVVIIISIAIGLIVFFISNALFGKKTVPVQPPQDINMNLSDDNVQILYEYVTYGPNNTRNDKFLKEQNVTLDSFNDEEKYYCALQFAQVEDFTATEEVDENNNKIYMITSTKIKNYMQRFFGNKVTYSTNNVITYPFDFTINNKNLGTITYSREKDCYNVVFSENKSQQVLENVVEPYYTKLVKATRKGVDGSLVLQEKAIFTETKVENDIYTVNIYKDFQHTKLIETRQNLTAEQLKENPISIENYLQKAATVTYLFKLNNTIYYFDSSNITAE